MNIRRAIQTFFRDPEPVSSFQAVVPGVNIVDGIAVIEEPLRSPVKGHNCIGYHYQSYIVLQSTRNPQPQIQKLKEAEVYAAFDLQMDGGKVRVIPEKKSRFNRESHMELRDHYGDKFHASEDIILPGARVRIRGTVKIVDGMPTLKMSRIAVLAKQVVQKGVVGDRKARKKKK